MICLLDTHTWIWFSRDDPRLSQTALETICQPDAQLALCSASIWEMAIKVALGKLKLPYNLDEDISAYMEKVNVHLIEPELSDYQTLTGLPFHHRDPFDRLLAVIALRMKCPIISCDSLFDEYGVQRVW